MASKYFSGISHFNYGQKESRHKIPTSTVDERGKMIGLYYSANWCPPCIEITKKIVHWYEKIQESDDPSKNLEVVFISFDKDEDEYNLHFDSMPWLAVPFENIKICNKLSEIFRVHNIPTLLLLDGATGTLITKEGRKIVDQDPDGEDFPSIVLETEEKP